MLNLVYFCTNCHGTFEAKTIDGRVVPPPDICERCLVPAKLSVNAKYRNRRKREPGQVYYGIQLVSKSFIRGSNEWVVKCLWCKDEPRLMSQTNLGNQVSCGCLRRNTLIINYWHVTDGLVNCTCRECSLTKDYDLVNDLEPIYCPNGCIGGK